MHLTYNSEPIIKLRKAVNDNRRIIAHCDTPQARAPKSATKARRNEQLAIVFDKPLWDENDLAVVLDVEVDTIRHMKVREEIPAVVLLNKRCWRVHRDAFLEHFKIAGWPKAKRGRPPKH